MTQVTERWLLPAPGQRPNKDVVRLTDGTYCWVEHNTNNIPANTFLPVDLTSSPGLDDILLDIIQNAGPGDIQGSTIIGSSVSAPSFIPPPVIAQGSVGSSSVVFTPKPNHATNDAAGHPAPHNNDNRTACYKCNNPIVESAGGMYQLCNTPGCEWYKN